MVAENLQGGSGQHILHAQQWMCEAMNDYRVFATSQVDMRARQFESRRGSHLAVRVKVATDIQRQSRVCFFQNEGVLIT